MRYYSDETAAYVAFIISLAFMVFVACVATAVQKEKTDNWWRDEMVRRGHATYYLDGNNDRQWNWNKEREEQPK
jgi:hypothetical protein